MLKYRVNRRGFNKTREVIKIEYIRFVDFENLIDETNELIDYDGDRIGKLMVTCECVDIDKIKNGGFINTLNTLYLNFGTVDSPTQKEFVFNIDYQVIGVNNDNRSFSFYVDKYYTLVTEKIVTGQDNEDSVFIYFEDYHYFDISDNVTGGEDNRVQNIPIYFKYSNINGETVIETINFQYLTPYVLVAPYDNFTTDRQKTLYRLIFNSTIQEDKENNKYKYLNIFTNDKITQEQYDELTDEEKQIYIVNDNEKEGELVSIKVYRDNFLFGSKTNYEFAFERPLADINVPIVNTFETTLYQMDLLNEQFVEVEKKKAINRIVDIEKDVYYPCISNVDKNKFTDVYKIKFNLHFREHRGDDWLVENESFWNGVEQNVTAKIVNIDDKKLTDDNRSDLLTFLGFTNNDVHYQKNKLKKSFLRLMFFDSTNPADQNMIGYSTIFFDTGNLFTKYVRYIEEKGYVAVGADKHTYAEYKPIQNKIGIKVDREYFEVKYINKEDENNIITPEDYESMTDEEKSKYKEQVLAKEEKRLSSQFVVKAKNMSKASSEGFYIYIWKDNEMALPQDLYMKVEFNHAGYGRTVPFMMPYWDSRKWESDTTKRGIKTFQEILDDWNSKPEGNLDNYKRVVWKYDGKTTDGHYGIRQYTKFSYIHLKYQYDKENDKHIYYLDPDTYGEDVTNQDTNEIEINLYEAKVR